MSPQRLSSAGALRAVVALSGLSFSAGSSRGTRVSGTARIRTRGLQCRGGQVAGILIGVACLFGAAQAFAADGAAAVGPSAESPAKYVLRYRFQPGQSLRWDVTHHNMVRTSVSQTTQTAETTSTSVKVWRVKKIAADGSVTFEQLVEDILMLHSLTGRDEVRYDSRTDKKPPAGFDDVANVVGVPLAEITLDARGKVLHREQKAAKAQASRTGELTIPLPEGAVALGESWEQPQEADVTAASGRVVHVKFAQQYTLDSVKTGVATITVRTQILSPITDPSVESQIVQFATGGEIRFDLDAGRILSQKIEVDRHVVGFRGYASSLHYMNSFSERFKAASIETDAVATSEPSGPAKSNARLQANQLAARAAVQ